MLFDVLWRQFRVGNLVLLDMDLAYLATLFCIKMQHCHGIGE
jgi:hypothetical protein